MSSVTLTAEEIEELTGYARATKALAVLHSRGFTRAFINRKGDIVLERTHYEAVTKGELQSPRKAANLTHFQRRAA